MQREETADTEVFVSSRHDVGSERRSAAGSHIRIREIAPLLPRSQGKLRKKEGGRRRAIGLDIK